MVALRKLSKVHRQLFVVAFVNNFAQRCQLARILTRDRRFQKYIDSEAITWRHDTRQFGGSLNVFLAAIKFHSRQGDAQCE